MYLPLLQPSHTLHFAPSPTVCTSATTACESDSDSRPTSGFVSSQSDSDVKLPDSFIVRSYAREGNNIEQVWARTGSNASSLGDSGTGSSQSIETTGGLAARKSRSPSVSSVVSSTDIDEYVKIRRDDSWDTLSSSSSFVGVTTGVDDGQERVDDAQPQRRRSVVHKARVSKMTEKLPAGKTLSAPPVARRLSQPDGSRTESDGAYEPVDDTFTAPPVPEDEPTTAPTPPSLRYRSARSRSSLNRLLNDAPGSKFMSLPRMLTGGSGASTLWQDRQFVIQDEMALIVTLPAYVSQGRNGRGRRVRGSFSPYTRVKNVTKILLDVSVVVIG